MNETQPETPINMNIENLFEAIKASGLKGRSGNGFLVYKKIESLLQSKPSGRKLLVNGVECDPGLVHDEWLLQNNYEQLVKGIRLVSHLIGAEEKILAVKPHDLPTNADIRIEIVPNRYPMGEEHILVNQIFGIKLDKNEIPSNKGILVMNLQTVLALLDIYKGVFEDCCRYITVADYTCGEAVVAKVKTGMKASDILYGIYKKQTEKKAYMGGGVMYAHEIEINEAITDCTNFIGYGQIMSYSDSNRCKKCGACTKRCPAKIKVKDIVLQKEKNPQVSIDETIKITCLKCGTCTFNCRAGKNVMNYIADRSLTVN